MRAFLTSSFVRWLLAAAALAFAVVTSPSIGLFLLPAAALLVVWAGVGAVRRPAGAAAGAVAGLGTILVLIGALNTFESCEAGGPCERGWAVPVLAAGIAIVLAALAAARGTCRRSTPG